MFSDKEVIPALFLYLLSFWLGSLGTKTLHLKPVMLKRGNLYIDQFQSEASSLQQNILFAKNGGVSIQQRPCTSYVEYCLWKLGDG